MTISGERLNELIDQLPLATKTAPHLAACAKSGAELLRDAILADALLLDAPPDDVRARIQQRADDLDELMTETEGTPEWAIHTATRNGVMEAMKILDGLEWDSEEEAWVRPHEETRAILAALSDAQLSQPKGE